VRLWQADPTQPHTLTEAEGSMDSKMNTLVWRYVGHCVEGQQFLIDGVDVWNHKWRPTNEPGVEVEDPLYHQPHSFNVWELESDGRLIRFAAGEFSNCIWGFYRRA
jgi:hypothetical protein